jgi:hypothetical protein
MFTLANAPQGIGRNLDNGFRLFFAGIGPAALLLLIMIIIDAILFVVFGTGFFAMMGQMEKGQMPAGGMGSIGVFVLLFMLVYFLFNNALIAKYGAIAYERELSIGGALATGARKILPVFIYGILYMIIVGISSIPLAILMAALKPQGLLAGLIVIIGVIPPMILGLSLYLGPYLIVIDDRGIFESLGASHKLVWGNWWRTALFFTIILIIMIAVMFAVQLTFGLIIALIAHAGPGDGTMSFMIVLQVINQLVSLVFMPVLIGLMIPYFHDLKLRKEGGDLASRITAA